MALDYPHFLVNFKIYEGTAGDDGFELARTLEAVQRRTGESFVVAPQTPDVARIVRETSLSVVVQDVDAVRPGRGNGRVSLDAVAAAGADGVLINHPESEATISEVEAFVDGCEEYGLDSLVSVDGVETGRATLAFDPDCLVFERPRDVATGESMATSQPGRVESFVSMVEDVNPRTRVLLGGGISTATDVERALELGADAAGASSAFLEATDRRAWLSAIADALSSGAVD